MAARGCRTQSRVVDNLAGFGENFQGVFLSVSSGTTMVSPGWILPLLARSQPDLGEITVPLAFTTYMRAVSAFFWVPPELLM